MRDNEEWHVTKLQDPHIYPHHGIKWDKEESTKKRIYLCEEATLYATHWSSRISHWQMEEKVHYDNNTEKDCWNNITVKQSLTCLSTQKWPEK